MRHIHYHLKVIIIFSLLTVLLTWPLIAYFNTHVPGDGSDDPALAWNLWWIKYQLIDQAHLDIFHTNQMFYPLGINLAFYTLTPLNGLLSIPLQTSLNLVISTNLLSFLAFILSGYGAFLLAKQELTYVFNLEDPRNLSRPLLAAAFLAGLVYAFSSSKLFYASLGQFNILSSQWIPFCILFILRMGRSHRTAISRHNALFAGLFLVIQTWAELTFASFLLIFIAIHFLWHTIDWWRQTRAQVQSNIKEIICTFWSIFSHYLIIGGVFLIGLLPYLWAMLPDLFREGDFFTNGGGFAQDFSANLMGYLVPTRLHPLWGKWVATLPFGSDKGQHIYIGYVGLIGAIVGCLIVICNSPPNRINMRWFWPFNTVVFWLLTLGPQIYWSHTNLLLPGPFALVSQLPFFNGNRYPSRYSVILILAIGILIAVSVYWFTQKFNGQAVRLRFFQFTLHFEVTIILTSVISLLFLFEHLSVPLPLSNFKIPSIYEYIATQPGNFTVLELPTGWRNGASVLGRLDTLIMMQQWYQTVYTKYRLGGNTSRNPAYTFQYFIQAPLLKDLISLMNADQENLAPVIDSQWPAIISRNQTIAPYVLNFLGVKFVIVHVDRSTPQLLRFIQEVLPISLIEEWQGQDWSGKPSTIRLYKVKQKSIDNWIINLASPEGVLYLDEGWATLGAHNNTVRYAVRSTANLLLNLPEEGGFLTLELLAPDDNVEILLNNHLLSRHQIHNIDITHKVTLFIPKGIADQLIDHLTIRYLGPSVPSSSVADLSSSSQLTKNTEVKLSGNLSIAVFSAGKDVGDYSKIYINGQNVAQNKIGYNLVALNSEGRILENVAFDTHDHFEASKEMTSWLQKWPKGTIIAGGVRDSASNNLSQDAVKALERLGVKGDLRKKLRWSHAFIGIVGTQSGTALEQVGLLQPVSVYIGSPIDSSQISGGIGKIKFSKIK